MAKKGQKQKKYSVEFKKSVILDMLNNNLGYRETVRKYWDTKSRAEESHYREELEYAQIEIEYLKKLDALVRAEERKNGKKRK